MKRVAPVLIASVLSAFLAVFVYQKFHSPDQIIIREATPVSFVTDKEAPAQEQEQSLFTSAPTNFVHAANNAKRAVVSIQARSSSGTFWRNSNFGTSTGSGVLISSDGYIATNNHVVEDGQEITVILNDQREFEAEVIGKDPATDLALLKIDVANAPSLRFGDSDSVLVGEWVLAIGNPFRLQSTVTAGIVSAKGRSIRILSDDFGIESFIQTDAAVNPGNSGGALVNTRGELIGINTAIITYSGQYEGFSFAVPSNLARKVLADLRNHGSVQRAWLGVAIRSVDDDIARSLGLHEVRGIYIDQVNERSAADAAGLRSGDVILSVDGVRMSGTPQFMEVVGQMRPGDRVELEYMRNGSRKKTSVVLSNRRNATVDFQPRSAQNILSELGMEARTLSQREKSRLHTSGVVVEKINRGSIIDRIHMEEEYIITKVNGQAIANVEELVDAITFADGMIILDGFYEKYPGDYPYAFRKE